MSYVINTRVGVVHEETCAALAQMKDSNLAPWDPGKAHLAIGALACPACLNGVPASEQVREGLLKDPDGAPYQQAVQDFVKLMSLNHGTAGMDALVAALEETAWYAWRDGHSVCTCHRPGATPCGNPHLTPGAER